MRVTNQMMTNSMLGHITSNKINMSKLENQYSTGKKILKPSDDPIVAVRALKLRSNLTELDQYLSKNIPDAESWMSVTESALDNVNSIITQMNKYCVQGSTDTLTAKDRTNILANITQLKQQIFQEGNSQYAGRYVFTGYRTDTPLIYTEGTRYPATAAQFSGYDIKETFTGKDVLGTSSVVVPADSAENPYTAETHRIQLSYNNLYTQTTTVGSTTTLTSSLTSIKYTAAGSTTSATIDVTKTMNSTDAKAYEPKPGEVFFLADTGELILGSEAVTKLKDATNIEVEYQKNDFAVNDLKPEHYFECSFTDKDGKVTNYQKEEQKITYEVNFGQTLQVNTEAKDAITHSMARLVDDITTAVNNVANVETQISKLKEQLQSNALTPDEKKELESKITQLNTALDLNKSIMQKTFSKAITTTQGFEDKVNVAVADLGSRCKRLELTKSRLEDQRVELEDLKSNNEDVDLVETVIRYKSAEAIYNSSLTAAGSVVKTNLLNFL